jgi:4-hydroxy-tetrahydrodipicolinate synthase
MVLEGNPEYEHHINPSDQLSASQRRYAEQQLKLFKAWYRSWPGALQ